jgi:hypothetical protein
MAMRFLHGDAKSNSSMIKFYGFDRNLRMHCGAAVSAQKWLDDSDSQQAKPAFMSKG